MPAVPITSREQYINAIGVLTQMEGTWHGVGNEERYLLVTQAQYDALVKAKVVNPENIRKKSGYGKKPRKTPKP